MTIGRNSKTVKLGRDNRFLIDDYESPLPIAYRLTKPLKLGKVHSGRGAFKFVLQEVPLDPDDNYELNIAEYYKYFEKDGTPKVISSEDRLKIEQQTLRRYCSIECDERAVYNGLDPTMFTAHFSDEEDEQILTPEWEIECDFLDKLTVEQDGNAIYISADNKALTNKSFVLSMYAGQYEKTSITVQIKALM